MNKEIHNPSKARSKLVLQLDEVVRRLLDITASLLGLILLAPFFLLIGIAIKRSSPGPVFYWGERAGKNNKPFKILKFRTMYERKESFDGPKVTAEDDPRVTPLGRILRQTKINELPQLWNVLRGDMSLVGPRPEDPAIVASWPEEVRKEILSVRPGITSPASIVYRNEEDMLQSSSLMDTYVWEILPSKLRLDQIYVRNRSFLTDLDVVFWTLIALIPRLKTFSVPEHLLYWGPLARFTYGYLGWFFVDFLVSFFAVATAGVLRRLTTPFDLGLPVAVAIALVIALLFSLINTVAGINRTNWSTARSQEAFDLAVSTGVVTTLVLVANLVFPTGTRFPISVIIISGILSYFGFVIVRYRMRLIDAFANRWINLRGDKMSSLGEKVLIVGAGEVARFANWLLTNENLAQAFTVVGMVDDNPRKVGTTVDGVTVIGTTSAIPELVKKHDVGLILFAIADINPTDQDRILSICQTTGARITPVPDILDSLKAQFPKSETEREVHFNKVLHNATIDRLTGAYNRQQFMRLASVELNRSQRYGHPLSLVALFIDYERPKRVKYAQSVAVSRVMQASARHCLENIRGIDLLGRYSDDLLLILLPETDHAAAALVARRIQQKITAQVVETPLGPVQIRVESNLATTRKDTNMTLEQLINKAIEPLETVKPAAGAVPVRETHLK
ncbi:MAG: diguanylate cyclase [Chloroflexi bacterium]|mgnify:CR=1 FL=1|nr:diguanylate cyclase [Chloroflexota bacterium]